MPTQVFGSPFVPCGSAQFAGADTVVSLASSTPTNSGGFGQTANAINAALTGGEKIVSLTFGVEGGTVHILTTGQTPTASIGVPYTGTWEWENSANRILACKIYIPSGVTVNVEYGK